MECWSIGHGSNSGNQGFSVHLLKSHHVNEGFFKKAISATKTQRHEVK